MIGRVPSITTVRQDPETRFLLFSIKNDESETSDIPLPSMVKIPTSDESPNLFLNARKILVPLSRDAEVSRYNTQSTIWESSIGPATSPSFVTCPIIKTGVLFFLANETILAVACLICGRDPAKPGISSLVIVWIESMINKLGLIFSTAETTFSKFPFEKINRLSFSFIPILSARIFICPSDSSPETYNTLLLAAGSLLLARATLRASSRSKVDFPTPGSPDNNTADPGTIPPPKTLSSSQNPVDIREAASLFILPICVGSVELAISRAWDFRKESWALNSENVFHDWHEGHLPYHLLDS